MQLTFNGTLTSTYPTLPPEGWTVTAQPDGTLTDEEGRSYRYLFWEGVADVDWKQDSGFLVKAEDAREFLEQSLTQLGLNELEQNDFITYWLPKLEKNGEKLCHLCRRAVHRQRHPHRHPAAGQRPAGADADFQGGRQQPRCLPKAPGAGAAAF